MTEAGTFGLRLRCVREQASLTRDELAAKIGATSNAIYQWEIGRTHPHHDMYPRIAEALSTSLDWLMAGRAP